MEEKTVKSVRAKEKPSDDISESIAEKENVVESSASIEIDHNQNNPVVEFDTIEESAMSSTSADENVSNDAGWLQREYSKSPVLIISFGLFIVLLIISLITTSSVVSVLWFLSFCALVYGIVVRIKAAKISGNTDRIAGVKDSVKNKTENALSKKPTQAVSKNRAESEVVDNRLRCPACNSTNVKIDIITNTQLVKKHHSIWYWIFFGWVIDIILWLCLTLPMLLGKLFGRKNQKLKQTNTKMAICQDCGNSWQVGKSWKV